MHHGNKDSWTRYNKSEKGRATARRFFSSEKGKEYMKSYMKSYVKDYRNDPEYKDRHRLAQKKYRETHKDKISQYNIEYQRTHAKEILKYHRKRYSNPIIKERMSKQRKDKYMSDEKYRSNLSTRNQRRWQRKKDEAYEILGNRCKRCGITDRRVLEIDHINGDGSTERKKGFGVLRIYQFIMTNPKDAHAKYQILCSNCNRIKGHEEKKIHRR